MASETVVILLGGDGSEHRVSVASAQNVARNLERAELWFWRRDGSIGPVSRERLLAFERPFERDLEPGAAPRWPSLGDALDSEEAKRSLLFLALHGGTGENGDLQALLEGRGIPFTGSGSEASRLAFDKPRARDCLSRRGILVAEAVLVDHDTATHERLAELFERHQKVVVKPVADGSSHGMRIVESERELAAVLQDVSRSPTSTLLAEAFIAGRELTVGVLEEESGPRALPCSEVVLESGRSFDYDGKYLGRGVREVTPAEASEEITRAAQAVALTAHEAIGCRGYSRTDVIVGSEGPVFLEINTLPGLTKASFIPQQLESAGISMELFLRRQLDIAKRRTDAG